MLLYEQDWSRYPTAIADTQTTNTEWLRTAALYKSMGIKNYYFHLALLQPQLQGIDPYSPDLTFEQKTAISLEIEFNPWYFFREVARVTSGNVPLKFRSNRPIIAMLWSFFSGIDFVLIMPRQIGKSVGCDMLELWLTDYYYRNTELMLFTKDDDLRKTNIARIKNARRLLPKWLNPITSKDADNTEVITCLARGNILKCKVGQMQAFLATNVGRGSTSPYVHVDEGPFIPNVHKSLPVLMQVTGTARENNEATDTLYGNIYTTTAGKKDSKEGKYMYNFINSGMYWNELLFDSVDKYEARKTVMLNSSKGRCLINGTFSHRQAGKTDEWLKQRILLADATQDEIDRDFFNKWTSGTESSALSTHILEIINNSERDPFYTSVSADKYMIHWYIDRNETTARMANGHYILGLDSSNAMGRDANALILTDIRDMSVIASSIISEANLHKYAMWLADFLIKYTNVTLIIENKSSAQGIIDTITAKLTALGIDPFKRMYNKVVDNYKLREEDFKEICKPVAYRPEQVYLKFKSTFGFMTTGNTREFLYNTVLQDAVKSVGHLVCDKNLSDEIKGLIVKNGRVDHLPGGHDDSVIAWLLCHWFVKHSKNLQFYGINPMDCLSLVSNEGATLTNDEIYDRKRLALLNVEIDNLKTDLIAAPSLIDSLRIEKLIAYKVKEARELGDITLSMDQIMKDVSENKVSKRQLRTSLTNLNRNRLGLNTMYR